MKALKVYFYDFKSVNLSTLRIEKYLQKSYKLDRSKNAWLNSKCACTVYNRAQVQIPLRSNIKGFFSYKGVTALIKANTFQIIVA